MKRERIGQIEDVGVVITVLNEKECEREKDED